jgi:hypothetical protein
LFLGLIIIGLLFGDKNDKGKKAETAVSVVPQSATEQSDKDDVAIKKIQDYHTKLSEANNEKNISLIDAIKSEIQAIDTKGCINEVVLTKSALIAYSNEPIEFSRKYGMHPYDKYYFEAITSKEVDKFDQRFEKDPSALEKFNIFSADEYYYYCLAKYLESRKIDHKISTAKYSINIIEYSCEKSIVDSQTKYDDTFFENGPDVKIVIAEDIGTNKAIIKAFPRSDGNYTDSYSSRVQESFTLYMDSRNSLYIMLFDIDPENGELLDYTKIPNQNYDDWLNIGSGCKVRLKVVVDSTKPKN